MPRFYGSIKGNARSEATRRGTARSGIAGHVRGWDLGCQVNMDVDSEGRDDCEIAVTGGSNSHRNPRTVARCTLLEGGMIQVRLFDPSTGRELFGVELDL